MNNLSRMQNEPEKALAYITSALNIVSRQTSNRITGISLEDGSGRKFIVTTVNLFCYPAIHSTWFVEVNGDMSERSSVIIDAVDNNAVSSPLNQLS
jgi:hypothetical protein